MKCYALVDLVQAWTTDAALLANPPKVKVHVLATDTGNTGTANADGSTPVNYFDIHPGSEFASGDSVTDKGQSGREDIEVDAASYNAASPIDICKEKWQLSLTATACVEMQVKVKRKRNTGDTTQDINLDYSYSYDMHAAIGKMSDTGDQALLFAARAVDFT